MCDDRNKKGEWKTNMRDTERQWQTVSASKQAIIDIWSSKDIVYDHKNIQSDCSIEYKSGNQKREKSRRSKPKMIACMKIFRRRVMWMNEWTKAYKTATVSSKWALWKMKQTRNVYNVNNDVEEAEPEAGDDVKKKKKPQHWLICLADWCQLQCQTIIERCWVVDVKNTEMPELIEFKPISMLLLLTDFRNPKVLFFLF